MNFGDLKYSHKKDLVDMTDCRRRFTEKSLLQYCCFNSDSGILYHVLGVVASDFLLICNDHCTYVYPVLSYLKVVK